MRVECWSRGTLGKSIMGRVMENLEEWVGFETLY